MRPSVILSAVLVGVILGCGGAAVDPQTPPVTDPTIPEPEAGPEPRKGGKGGGRKAPRDGKPLGSLQFEGGPAPVTVQGTTLKVGRWSTTLSEEPFQVLLVN